MTTVTWAQLTPGQQAYLDVLARCSGGGWYRVAGITPELSNGLVELGFIEQRNEVHSYYRPAERITPAGLAVWQQGQVASVPPRSVWVAMWHEYGEGDYLLSIHAQHETAQTACEVHAEQALKWEYAAGFDGMGEYRARVYDDDVLQGEYFVHEMPVLP